MKPTILFHSNFSLAKTGFGRNSKAVLSYLYKTGKYNLVNYATGMPESHAEYQRMPWKTVGCLPNSQQEIDNLNRDQNVARAASYGGHLIDKAIKDLKPHLWIGCEDVWAFGDYHKRKWYKNINTCVWTTLDSLPIISTAVDYAKNEKNFFVWSEFAEKGLHELGCANVKTLHGAVETEYFYRLPLDQRMSLREKFNLPKDAFIIGFVFRNQLRKSVPNLLEGYHLWKSRNPEVKNTFLLLHTHFGEGWNIHKLAEQYKVNKNEILCTYICRNCGEYEVKNFVGQEQKCRFCEGEKGQITVNVGIGVSEEQLNQVYNLMDVYIHPFTSGGQEIPIQEAKLAGLVTLVTSYSCGEDMCVPEAYSVPLDWSKYTEHGTEFIKASTSPLSIAKQLTRVYRMSRSEREEMGDKARSWTLENYSSEVVGKKLEDFIDSLPNHTYDFLFEEKLRNAQAVIPEIKDDTEWLIKMYKDILNMTVDVNDSGLQTWQNQLKNGAVRINIENYFRKVALEENAKNVKIDFEDLLGKDEKKRVLYVMPQSIGDIFISTALFKSIKERYPDHVFYVATMHQYKNLLDGNPYVDRVIDYIPEMDNLLWLEGVGDHKGFFNIAYLPYFQTQRQLSHLHNAEDEIHFSLE